MITAFVAHLLALLFDLLFARLFSLLFSQGDLYRQSLHLQREKPVSLR